jgi:two-component system, chemotaxis family, chemotaxis protein CheY
MKTCLIVDDSGIIRKVARRILESLGFQTREAENGEQAFETCLRELPDAILLDWNMPKMDGYDFLRALRRLPGGERPKVVFCTTENDVAHIATISWKVACFRSPDRQGSAAWATWCWPSKPAATPRS